MSEQQRGLGEVRVTRGGASHPFSLETAVATVAIIPVAKRGDPDYYARRLAACWNACEELGVSTEDLESGALKQLLVAAREALDNAEGQINNEYQGTSFYEGLMKELDQVRDTLSKFSNNEIQQA